MSINYPEPAVQVYGKPGCGQCFSAKLHFDTKKIPSEYIDVTKDDKAMKWVTDMGYSGVPVIRIGFEHFYGFDMDKINASLDKLQAA